MHHRAVGIVIRDNEVLLMRRIKNGEVFFTFPGGMVEEDEDPATAALREVKEETNIDARVKEKLCAIENMGRMEHYFVMEYVAGEPSVVGEEKDRMSIANQYYPGWYALDKALALPNLYPRSAVEKLQGYLFAGIEKLPTRALSTTVGKQSLMYAVSVLLPPFGLGWGFKYLRDDSSTAKRIGITIIILTVASLAANLWAILGLYHWYFQLLNSITDLNF